MVPLDELLGTLLSWAVFLSGYQAPNEAPEISRQEHAFFVEHACGGKECDVLAWYNDEDIIYLDQNLTDERLEPILVHELTHYLQHKSGRFITNYCPDSIKREREAYHVQNMFTLESVVSFRLKLPRDRHDVCR